MKKIILLAITLNSLLLASGNTPTTAEENLRLQMEAEKRISQEQTFHKGKDYNLKVHEVNADSVNNSSLDSIPELNELDDDFDMDDVY